MNTLYLEKWQGTFQTSRGKEKFPVLSVWQYNKETKKIVRLAEWIYFPWGGTWEDVMPSEKDVEFKKNKLCKKGWKHSYPLEPVSESKCLSAEQLEGLSFLVQYPERGWANWKKFKSL